MVLKLKNFEIVNILQVLDKLGNADLKSIKVSYKIGKIAKALSDHAKDYEEARKEIVDKYAEKDKDGEYVSPVNDKGEKQEGQVSIKDTEGFNKEVMELTNEEVEATISVYLTIDDLESAEAELKAFELVPLQPILDASQDPEGGE